MKKIAEYAKALAAGATAFATSMAAALSDDVVTQAEWFGIAGATLAALGIVWAVPNAKPADE